MKAILSLLICAIGLSVVENAFAQKENNVWHFGDKAGIDFNVTPPQPIVSPYIGIIEGSATVCDPITGQLLISTDGTTVWNRDLEQMPNGSGLLGGGGTSTQGALILPFPRSDSLYYIFTCDQAGYTGPNQGVKYSIVDMSLDGGKGDVTVKNLDVFAPEMTEKLTAIPHSNGCDFWVIAHKKSRDFMAIQVGDTVIGKPVVSSVGHLVSSRTLESIGYLVSNQAGTMLAYITEDASAWIYDFDRTTGVVSDPKTIYTTGDHLYGACFSPDGTKLYVGSYSPGMVMQFDVTLPTANEIKASRTVIYSNSGLGIGVGGLRPGPDGKIYVGMWNTGNPSYLGVISDPNARGAACNFDPEGIALISGTQVQLGLPNVLDAYIGRSMQPCFTRVDEPVPVSIDAEFGTICAGDCIEFTQIGAGDRKIVWKVSDGRTIENIATSTICFDTAGNYTIELLAVGAKGDTTRSPLVPVTIKPALSYELRSFAITTDTIGAVIKVPIVLNDAISSTFSAGFSFDPDLLEYAGAFDKDGNPIDAGSRPEEGELLVSKQLASDSVIGYLYFNLYWEEGARCRSVQLTSSSLSNTSVQCLSSSVNYEMCLDEACGTPLMSELLRTSRIQLQVAPNPAASRLLLTVDHDIADATITLIDASGKEMLRQFMQLRAGAEDDLDVSSLATGIYFLSVQSPVGAIRQTIVIRR